MVWWKPPEEAQLRPEKVMVLEVISLHGIIGPVFIRGTITSSSYHSLLKDDIISELNIRGHLMRNRAKPHTSDKNLLLLRNTFKNCVISNRFSQLFNTGWNQPPTVQILTPVTVFRGAVWKTEFTSIILRRLKLWKWKLCELCETWRNLYACCPEFCRSARVGYGDRWWAHWKPKIDQKIARLQGIFSYNFFVIFCKIKLFQFPNKLKL